MRAGVALACLLAVGCAWGNADWRRDSHRAYVHMPGAGDEQCSPPAPWPQFKACLPHDLAYEMARQSRCRGWDEPDFESEQARMVSDLELGAAMAADGYGETVVLSYVLFVRTFGWWTWHFSPCP